MHKSKKIKNYFLYQRRVIASLIYEYNKHFYLNFYINNIKFKTFKLIQKTQNVNRVVLSQIEQNKKLKFFIEN